MTEKDLEIQELKRKVKQLKKEKQYIINYIENECIYDEHLKSYCFDLSRGKVRTLMNKINPKKD